MSLNNKPLDSIEEGDLQSLVDNEVPEDKTLDYKESLPGNSDAEKKESLADVSSFANASGGHLVFGMKEQEGVAVELCRLRNVNADAEILRLENMIRASIEPRIPGISTRAIPLQTSGVAIIMYIPRSWTQPHVVKVKGHWRFYSRHSAGKYPLDVAELRSAFALSETIAERIRNFRIERLSAIIAGETPIAVNEGPKLVLHSVPFSAFDPSVRLDIASLTRDAVRLPSPLYSSRFTNYRHNFDGLLTHDQSSRWGNSYVQIFRNGSIESVALFRCNMEDKTLGRGFEEKILAKVSAFLATQKRLGVEPPFLLMLSALGIFGYTIDVPLYSDISHPIDRDALLIPEVLAEDFESDLSELMKPAFDAIWNATGIEGSPDYDAEGKWKKP